MVSGRNASNFVLEQLHNLFVQEKLLPGEEGVVPALFLFSLLASFLQLPARLPLSKMWMLVLSDKH